MNGEQDNPRKPEISGQGIPVGEGSLFAVAAKKVEEKREKERERMAVAKVVVQWFEGFKKKEEIKPGATLQEMATSVLQGLNEGRIFFAVRLRERMALPIKAESRRVNFPLQDIPDPNYPTQLVKVQPWGTIVILAVQKGIELPELLTFQGEEQLRKLYEYDKNIDGRGRIKVEHPINIKDPDIGPFPKLD